MFISCLKKRQHEEDERRKSRDVSNSVNCLPEEVLCKIFDYLDLRSVKSASLTCSRWNRIIFLSSNIGQFMLDVDPWKGIPGERWMNAFQLWNCRRKRVRDLQQMLKHTQRCYRGIRCKLREKYVGIFPALITNYLIIHPHLAEQLQTLDIFIEECLYGRVLPLLADALIQMPRLHSLILTTNHSWSIDWLKKITFQSSSVRHMKMSKEFPVVIDMLALESFEGPLHALQSPVPHDQCIGLSIMKELKKATILYSSDGISRFFQIKNIIRRLTQLEQMTWGHYVNEKIFVALCDLCASLKELRIMSEFCVSDPNVLRHLANLTQLRLLGFESIYDCYLELDIFEGFHWEDLCNLEYLELGSCSTNLEFMEILPKTIKIVERNLCLFRESEKHFICHLQHLPHLKKLHLYLDYYYEKYGMGFVLEALVIFEHLEILELSEGAFKKSHFLTVEGGMPSVRTLKLISFKVESKHLPELLQWWPNLKKLEFYECQILGSFNDFSETIML